MNTEEFRTHGHRMIDWIADYYDNIEKYPVKSAVAPRAVYDSLPEKAPEIHENFEEVFSDFEAKILPGITHWQNPNFFAYFNANTSFPSILGELLSSAIGAQCMIWETSPAAAELEEKVCNWIKDACGLPASWHGVIQDTASTATLCALLMAREKASDFAVNHRGFYDHGKFTIYCSAEAHSSIVKGAKIAGFGKEHIRKVPFDEAMAMIPAELERLISEDEQQGFVPLCVISAVGTTGSHGMDPVRAVGEICNKYQLFHHVDAAHAGNAAILPEHRQLLDGLELADSYVFNPHKWMFTNFDCSLFYVKDKGTLLRTFEIMPEYLKTAHDRQVNNYRDWGIQLGRRFRALKLWFVLRDYGLEGIRQAFRQHIAWAQYFAEQLENHRKFELLAPVPLNLVCFRYVPENAGDLDEINRANEAIEQRINASGEAYLTHTKLNGQYTLRVCIGQTNVKKEHVDKLLELLIRQVEMD